MKKLLLSLLAIILIIEEWLWDTLSALGHFLACHLGFARFEQWLLKSSPYQALFAISVPILLITPINITAFWLLGNGLIVQGIALEIVAKLLGTLFVAHFFTLTKKQLLTFRLLAWIYNTVSYWLIWAHERVIETEAYRWAKKIKTRAKATMAAWLKKN
ncbi:MAG: hypothetical protein NTW85_12215 [Methylococcales bacterium]|nr:hypothetical protein [Methylococcales bacterium]